MTAQRSAKKTQELVDWLNSWYCCREQTAPQVQNIDGSSMAQSSKVGVSLKDKMRGLHELAKSSPLQRIPAEVAIEHYANMMNSQGSMEKEEFTKATVALAQRRNLQVDVHHIHAVFSALDMDGTGMIPCSMWACGVPLFFGGGRH
eukprot:gnl/MRDRNA2_/MRDRNA2_36523_c0_seq1.p1 gnl/MRDRNA2_/MRDRNA2_36523_c0~~gnl/MRDRNA2_/MRDRNA2_36523_c0_seq1.p1  ORF type:complete len:161 (-),score=29.55 gnl/MRDRNA2_/MRDRNA2_36523_c0_seq1:35-472(-)